MENIDKPDNEHRMKSKRNMIKAMILPMGFIVAFFAYLASEFVLGGRWIDNIVHSDDWTGIIRIATFIVVAASILFFSRFRFTEYKRIVESEESYEAVLEKSLLGVIVYRGESVLFMNASVRNLLGYKEFNLKNETLSVWSLFDPDDHLRIKSLAVTRDLGKPVDLHYECRLITLAGESLWAEIVSFVVHYGGRSAVLINIKDITEQKHAQEQLIHSTRLAELGEMAASVAHEINQPLTGIRNYARNVTYMLENDVGKPQEMLETLQNISEQVDRAARIITQMRDLTRRADREFVLLDINDAVKETLDFLTHQFKLSEILVKTDLADGLPRILGDRVRLEQVLLNIMTNARQSMEEVDDRRLEICTAHDMRASGVLVEISDTGKGFTHADNDKIFTPFYSTKNPGEGTGLGLSISLSIIEQHGGVIEAWGGTGSGARFTIRLPAAEDRQDTGDCHGTE